MREGAGQGRREGPAFGSQRQEGSAWEVGGKPSVWHPGSLGRCLRKGRALTVSLPDSWPLQALCPQASVVARSPLSPRASWPLVPQTRSQTPTYHLRCHFRCPLPGDTAALGRLQPRPSPSSKPSVYQYVMASAGTSILTVPPLQGLSSSSCLGAGLLVSCSSFFVLSVLWSFVVLLGDFLPSLIFSSALVPPSK